MEKELRTTDNESRDGLLTNKEKSISNSIQNVAINHTLGPENYLQDEIKTEFFNNYLENTKNIVNEKNVNHIKTLNEYEGIYNPIEHKNQTVEMEKELRTTDNESRDGLLTNKEKSISNSIQNVAINHTLGPENYLQDEIKTEFFNNYLENTKNIVNEKNVNHIKTLNEYEGIYNPIEHKNQTVEMEKELRTTDNESRDGLLTNKEKSISNSIQNVAINHTLGPENYLQDEIKTEFFNNYLENTKNIVNEKNVNHIKTLNEYEGIYNPIEHKNQTVEMEKELRTTDNESRDGLLTNKEKSISNSIQNVAINHTLGPENYFQDEIKTEFFNNYLENTKNIVNEKNVNYIKTLNEYEGIYNPIEHKNQTSEMKKELRTTDNESGRDGLLTNKEKNISNSIKNLAKDGNESFVEINDKAFEEQLIQKGNKHDENDFINENQAEYRTDRNEAQRYGLLTNKEESISNSIKNLTKNGNKSMVENINVKTFNKQLIQKGSRHDENNLMNGNQTEYRTNRTEANIKSDQEEKLQNTTNTQKLSLNSKNLKNDLENNYAVEERIEDIKREAYVTEKKLFEVSTLRETSTLEHKGDKLDELIFPSRYDYIKELTVTEVPMDSLLTINRQKYSPLRRDNEITLKTISDKSHLQNDTLESHKETTAAEDGNLNALQQKSSNIEFEKIICRILNPLS
ncbi:hypothetical protein CDAR_555001 [Caerostris darwini]|uniref:Uncharacterized protein n=1 Tax=Caerostris darwini TaxID=1538125 RepID=A0AAV4RKR2_9ARAC|nr:hypothetical protein CDAR_555001 [Caerostris darwini]